MSCNDLHKPVQATLNSTATAKRWTWLTGWMPSIALDDAACTMKLAGVVGSLRAQPCYQLATIRTDKPSSPVAVGSQQSADGEYYYSSTDFALSAATPGTAYVRFGRTWFYNPSTHSCAYDVPCDDGTYTELNGGGPCTPVETVSVTLTQGPCPDRLDLAGLAQPVPFNVEPFAPPVGEAPGDASDLWKTLELLWTRGGVAVMVSPFLFLPSDVHSDDDDDNATDEGVDPDVDEDEHDRSECCSEFMGLCRRDMPRWFQCDECFIRCETTGAFQLPDGRSCLPSGAVPWCG